MKKKILEILITACFLAVFIYSNRNIQIEQEIVVPAKYIEPTIIPEVHSIHVQEEIEEEIRDEIYYGELELLALLVQAEAGNQDELGKRYVADVVLNRVDSEYFPDTIEEVIYQGNPTQFAVTKNGALEKAGYTITEDVFNIVLEESEKRVNDKIVYFKTNCYHSSGHPAFKHQDHYFSTK